MCIHCGLGYIPRPGTINFYSMAIERFPWIKILLLIIITIRKFMSRHMVVISQAIYPVDPFRLLYPRRYLLYRVTQKGKTQHF